ncbi:uroporphyrinogen-III synthase [Capnocytophaga canimorsus]|uniref:uroporphyrinogen-III synthase n=1 Tax=Capnocytophaga canimorsus TaxID=28188 RepID=UPI00384AE0EF
MRILLATKILSETQKKSFEHSDFQIIQHDFITIKHSAILPQITGDILLFTSQNAVRSVLKSQMLPHLKSIPAVCVGEKTAKLLKENGWKVLFFKPYAADLAVEILQKIGHRKITFFCGNLRRDTLPDFFNKHNLAFEEIQVYQTYYTPKAISEKVYGILFFSPSEVKSYLLKNSITTQILFCIGTTTAQEAQKHSLKVVIADSPTVESVIAKCLEY